ncbi:MAG: DUF429 domain-containing protein [Planctomycetia bacterium]|nr:DUF429 domain-containing protein [Planctomycetia bacterium]
MTGRGARLVIGVDFTSAPCPRKPITVAVGRLSAGNRPVYRLDEVLALESLSAFEAFLRDDRPWIGGFDLPFGQPRPLVEHEGWPADWRRFVRFYCARPRETLRDAFRRWCDARPAGGKFAWRKTDKPAGSSPAMRWANPPVAWMMHAGIGRMLEAGLTFPAHRHPPRSRATGGRVALEAYPAFTARQVCPDSYKSDIPARHTAGRRRNRDRIVRALEQGAAGLSPRLVASTPWRRRLVADGSGDLLDAVICALQAAHAALLPRYGLPRGLDPLEGWIATVPVG